SLIWTFLNRGGFQGASSCHCRGAFFRQLYIHHPPVRPTELLGSTTKAEEDEGPSIAGQGPASQQKLPTRVHFWSFSSDRHASDVRGISALHRKRTNNGHLGMSALCQKRLWASQFTRTHCRKRPTGRYGLGSRVCRVGRRELNVFSVKIKVPASWRTGDATIFNIRCWSSPSLAG